MKIDIFTSLTIFRLFLASPFQIAGNGRCILKSGDSHDDPRIHLKLRDVTNPAECLALCKTKAFASGCEYRSVDGDCIVHTLEVVPEGEPGDDRNGSYCWPLQTSRGKY